MEFKEGTNRWVEVLCDNDPFECGDIAFILDVFKGRTEYLLLASGGRVGVLKRKEIKSTDKRPSIWGK